MVVIGEELGPGLRRGEAERPASVWEIDASVWEIDQSVMPLSKTGK